jgi:spore coat protein U-like protein
MRRILSTALVAASAIVPVAHAATATTTFPVTATVLATCNVSATPLAFGNYTPGAGAVTNTSTVSVRCTRGTPFTVALNAGTTTGGTLAQRLMATAANTLQYNLYTTSAYTTIWGDGTGGSSTQAGTGSGVATPVAFTAYGRLLDSAANQAAVTGAFSDTITVTVTY